MPLLADRIQETTNTVGTGTLTLAGAVTGYRTFNVVFANGNVVFYTIDDGLGNWEVGYGTVGTGTLSRDTVLDSSNAGALVSFNAGSKRVFCTAPSVTLLPNQTSNSGKVLTTDGSVPSWTPAAAGTVTAVSVNSSNGLAGTSSGGATPALTLSTTVTGVLKGNGTTISAATAGTDYAAATTGTNAQLLANNGSGGFSNVTVGSGLNLATGTLTAPSTMTYPGAGIANSTGSAWGTSYTTSGSGTVVALATSPSFTTPTLGVATATTVNKVTLTAPATGSTLTIADGKTLTASNTLTFTGTDASSVAFGAGGTVIYSGGALGTPSSGTLSSCTGLPISTGVSGLGSNVANFLATPSSANLASALTDKTGSGSAVFATSPTLVTPTLGVASATTVNKVTLTAPATGSTLTIADGKTLTASNSITLAGTDSTTMTFPPASASVGYLNIPQNAQTSAYTLVLADSGKHIYMAAAQAATTMTIPANGTVAFPIGTAVTFVNMSANAMTIAITTDTMYLGGTGTTGSRTLAQYGTATALKMTSTTWIISGSGLT